MEPRDCYCRDDRPPRPGIPQGYCGICCLCGAPGHTRHHPGMLPYTGSWCDTHFEQMVQVYTAAFSDDELLPGEPAGLPKQNCRYLRIPDAFEYRRFFRRYQMDAYLEFRRDVLTRYLLHDSRINAYERHERWDHPLGIWIHPYPMERDDTWQAIAEDDFESRWQSAVWPKNSRRRQADDA